jgi:hypothetical protein
VFYAFDRKQAVEAAEGRARQTRTQINQALSVHNEAKVLLDENVVERALVDHLAEQSIPLNGLLRVERTLATHNDEIRDFSLAAVARHAPVSGDV